MTVKRLILTFWHGPFSLGPLTKPVAVGDAVMKVLEVAWKFGFVALNGCIVIVIIVGLAYLASLVEDAQRNQQYASDESARLAAYNPADHVTKRVEYHGKRLHGAKTNRCFAYE